jgi:surface protein
MYRMFYLTDVFNQPIGDWDVSNVTDMNSMFQDAIAFNQDISSWDVSNVTDMTRMFRSAYAFNQDISNWSVANVIICNGFSTDTPQWTLPKPTFTNCIP